MYEKPARGENVFVLGAQFAAQLFHHLGLEVQDPDAGRALGELHGVQDAGLGDEMDLARPAERAGRACVGGADLETRGQDEREERDRHEHDREGHAALPGVA